MTAAVQAHLREKAALEPPRTTHVLHPSEISQDGWCPRAAYYKILEPPAPEYITARQRAVFEYGNAAHERWQANLAEMGKLEGYWRCLVCSRRFYQQGKPECRGCHSTSAKYMELSLSDPDLMISGHTDGMLWEDQAILEVKTVGVGTVRYYAPRMVDAHTYEVKGHKVTDLDGIWDSIRRPFSSHLRQGMLYTRLARQRQRFAKVDKVIFLYESKMNQDTKEFLVKYDESLIESIIAGARSVAMAVRGEGPIPECRGGAASCIACQEREGAVL